MTEVIPPVLFKYLPPERIDVLTRGWVRISQRQVVNDFERDFQPPYLHAAPPEVLAHYIYQQVAKDEEVSESIRPAFVNALVERFGEKMLSLLVSQLKTPDLMGMVSLTNDPTNEHMWCRYAACRTGFVLALDTRLFAGTVVPRLFVKRVDYSDEPIIYASEGIRTMASFFRKNMKWQVESEWRGIGLLSRFPVALTAPDGTAIHACAIPEKAVLGVVIRKECSVARELSNLLAIDCRYRHAVLKTVP